MSHTDKHRPLYVQLADEHNPAWWKEEIHRHHNPCGSCDLKIPDDKAVDPRLGRRTYNLVHERNSRSCHVWVSGSGWRAGMWPKGSGRPRSIREHGRDGVARADLRRLKHKWLHAVEVEDIDSTENLPTNKWLWDHTSWSWD